MDKYMIIFSAAVIILIGIILYLGLVIPSSDEVQYIKREMKRSSKDEYRYWRHMLREYYRKHVPFIGKIIAKLIK